MQVIFEINGTDRTANVDWRTLEVEQQLTNQVDTANFGILKHAAKTYAPSVGDTVYIAYTIDEGSLLTEDGNTLTAEDGSALANDVAIYDLFGGTVTRIDDVIEAGLLTRLSVQAVSYERALNRFLAVRELTSQSARYMINTLVDEFVNTVTLALDLGESGETWTQEAGTLATDTSTGNYIEGDQSRKLTATASSTAAARAASTLDLTTFADSTASTTSDLITLHFKVDDPSNFTSLTVRIVTDSGATYTNYFEYIITSTPRTGWNQAVIAKSAFTEVGSPDWSSIEKRQYTIAANSGGSLNVWVDDVRMVQSTAFTQQNVQDADDLTLGSAKFNYEQMSDCLKQIAEAVGCDWYVDASRDIHFFAPATEPAPFGISDTSNNLSWNTLRVRQDSNSLRNQVYVRGGEYQGTSTDYSVVADGASETYRSPYRIKNISVTVGGVSQTVGVDFIDDPASYDCLYNYQEKTLKFPAGSPPSNGSTIVMTGNPMAPVIVKKSDPASISDHGVYEYVIVDKSITTKQGARDRASAELTAYKNALVEGSFETDTGGLHAGQTISIAITARGISGDYIIQTLTARPKGPASLNFRAEIVSTRTLGIIEYLLGELRKDRKQIVLNDSEVVDVVQDIGDSLSVSDSWAEAGTNGQTETVTVGEVEQDDIDHGTVFVLTPYSVTGFSDTKRLFILNGSPLG